MKITLKEITVAELFDGYADNEEDGVVGFGGKLNIRPKYQREFIYSDKQRDSVIDTLRKSFPLNVMYWAVNSDGTFELLDGQQRTVSICRFLDGVFSVNAVYFHTLTQDQKDAITNYRLMVYLCEGTDSEKLDWFRTINIAGAKLSDQELRNAIYTGPWLSDAKKYFSKTGCVAHKLGANYLSGVAIRQEILETALNWITEGKSDTKIEQYMALHQNDPSALELWQHFSSVIEWVKGVFPNYRDVMKQVPWGELYRSCGKEKHDPKKFEAEIVKLMMNDEVTKKSGIYAYILTSQEKHLNLRAFSESMKWEAYERQKHLCPLCKNNKQHDISEMEADHEKPWHEGGKTIAENCQMLCKPHNRKKGGR